MSAIVSVERTGGGERAYCCPNEVQNLRSMNITITTPNPDGSCHTNRIRLCDACARRLYAKMKHYVPPESPSHKVLPPTVT